MIDMSRLLQEMNQIKKYVQYMKYMYYTTYVLGLMYEMCITPFWKKVFDQTVSIEKPFNNI